jgi:antitoxin HicB
VFGIFCIFEKKDKMQRTYRVLLNKEQEGGYTFTVPSLPGCVTYVETIEESIDMAKEAIGLYIESMKAHGEPIPKGDLAHGLVFASATFQNTFLL